MKVIALFVLFACLAGIAFEGNAQTQNKKNEDTMNSMNDKGMRAPAENFTGTVWVTMNISQDDPYNMIIATVRFEPLGRTNWHSHTTGQILLVTAGMGYYQEKGKPAQIIREGDVVKIPKNVVHWHGASQTQPLTHVAIVPELDKDKTDWYEPVDDAIYNAVVQSFASRKINLTEAAVKNHKELWPDYNSRIEVTDPELIEIFDNFAFDEVISQGNLEPKTRVMVILASSIASQAMTEYKMYVNAALNIGISPVEIKEILYQAVPYVGIAKVIDFIHGTNDVMMERGIALPLEGQSNTNRENRFEKGLAVQKAIFGDVIDYMRKNAPQGQEHIQDFLSANCFGDYYTRSGLDIKTRELLTFAMLISMGGTESQVKGHIQGNLSVGNGKETLLTVVTQLLPYIGYPRTLNAIKSINDIITE